MAYRHDIIVYDPEDDEWRYTGYPGYYVSNTGHVIGPGRHGHQALLTPRPGNKHGHLEVGIHVNGKRIHKYVHRLVAEAFIPNRHNYPQVRHLDDDPTNNHVENLAWGTQSDNVEDMRRNGNARCFTDEERELAMRKRRTPIKSINLSNGHIRHFISQQEAARYFGVEQSSINGVVSGRNRSLLGHSFAHENEEFPEDVLTRRYIKRGYIKAINVETGEESIFRSNAEAARSLGMSPSSISMILSGKHTSLKGYRFEYLGREGCNYD